MVGVDQQRADRRRSLGMAGLAVAGSALPLLTRSSPIVTTSPMAQPALALAPVPNLKMPRLFPRAIAALEAHAGRIGHRDRIGIADFSEASRVPRFHLVDVASGAVTTYLVAHGSGSDPDHSGWLRRFSNQPDSDASSRGAFLTSE